MDSVVREGFSSLNDSMINLNTGREDQRAQDLAADGTGVYGLVTPQQRGRR